MVFQVDNIVVPVSGRNRDVDHSFRRKQFSFLHLQHHFVIAAAAGCVNVSILVEHGGNTERVPNAVAIPGMLAGSDRKGRGHGGEWSSSPELPVFLQHKGVSCCAVGAARVLSCVRSKRVPAIPRDSGSPARTDKVIVNIAAKAGIAFLCALVLGRHTLSFTLTFRSHNNAELANRWIRTPSFQILPRPIGGVDGRASSTTPKARQARSP